MIGIRPRYRPFSETAGYAKTAADPAGASLIAAGVDARLPGASGAWDQSIQLPVPITLSM
jgi:hypothetical protein